MIRSYQRVSAFDIIVEILEAKGVELVGDSVVKHLIGCVSVYGQTYSAKAWSCRAVDTVLEKGGVQ